MVIELSTPDGPCATTIVVPPAGSPRHAVIVFHDAAGPRPAQTRILERIAEMGYVAVQPNLFHRSPPLESFIGAPVTLTAVQKVFQNPELKARFMAEYYQPALGYPNLEATVGAVLAHLEEEHDARRVGTTGYCMGGNASFRAATIFGARIAAAAAFHPGGLVTDQPDSPHLRARSVKARLYIAPATGDLAPDAEAKLRAALDAGGVHFDIAHYDAKHGYAVEDAATHDGAAAERHYQALETLFRQAL
ncbi:MAG: dienelactone hydrolase family protein [Myxococcota bacterium]